ncbi:MAG: hypothetical protein ACP5NW_00950 [Candidatus Woesearchaeota archaeon]
MNTKFFAMFLAFVILCTGMVNAVNLEITDLEVNGRDISSNSMVARDFNRGEELDVYVCVESLTEVRDAQIYAYITGYDYANDEPEKVYAVTDTFDLLASHSDCFDLELEVPTKIDKDYFKLRIRADDRNGESVDQTYQLYLKGIERRTAIEIRDFSLDPQEVIAGRAFTAKVKIKNLWDDTIDDLKVTVSIPELNIKVSEYLEEVDPDESKTFEELLLRIPECAKAGTYDVEILVEFDEYRETQATGTIDVLSNKDGLCGAGTGTSTPTTPTTESKTVVSVPNSQEASQGTSVVYPIVISNSGLTAQTYTLSVTGASTWATTRIDPSAVLVVPAGQSKTAYLYVGVNNNAELGDKALTLSIDSNGDTKNVPLVAKITKSAGSSDWSAFKRALEIGLVVLVVILIIVGLIIGFSKMKEDKQESEPYY